MKKSVEIEKNIHKKVIELVRRTEIKNNFANNCNESFSKRDINCIEIGFIGGMESCRKELNEIMREYDFSEEVQKKIINRLFY